MFRKQGSSKKTCMSSVVSVLSLLSPKKLFIFFLLATAEAHQPIFSLKSYRGGLWNNTTCRQTSPDCLLEVSPPPLFKFEHICDENLLRDIRGKSFLDQQRDERFIGQTLCHDTVQATSINLDGSLNKHEVIFDRHEEGSYEVRFYPPKIPIKLITEESLEPITPEPIKMESPKPVEKETAKSTSEKCRVGMWAVSGQGSIKTEKNPHAFRYKFIGESDEEVIDYSHICRVMPKR